MVQASTADGGWFDDGWHTTITRRLGRAMAVSLALHVGVLIVIAFVRLPQLGERPLASIEISLSSLPTPTPPPPPTRPVKISEPPKVQQKPVEVPKPVPAKAATAPAPVPRIAPVPPPQPAPVKLSNDVLRDVMKGVELPPDAPKFGDFSPVEKPKKAQLKLPEVPVVSETKESVSKPPDVKPHPSLTEDLNKELDEELRKIRKMELPKVAPVEIPQKPAPQLEAKVPSVKAVDTNLKVPGMAPGSNAYLGRVRQRISSFWSAPPVDITGQSYVVVIKFRLHRNGTVTAVSIEQSSGNDYYDLAGKRAVVSAIPLPAFPSDLTESYFDAHFTFTVGEQQG